MLLLNPYRFAAAAALTPVDVGAALWLDCYDSSTITNASGFASQINDKSNNSRHATQSTAANRPAITSASGKQVLRFDGVNDFLDIASSFFPSGAPSGVSFIIAAVAQESNGGYGGIISTQKPERNDGCSLSISNNRLYEGFPPLSTLSASTGASLAVITYVVAAGAGSMYFNGTLEGSGSAGTYSIVNDTVTTIGRYRVEDANYGAFDLHQLAVVTGSSSSTIRQQLEGWAAWTAELQGSLPAGHPYKNAAPQP